MTADPTIKLSITLSDGTFETSIIVPLRHSEADRSRAIERWLGLAGHAMALGVENMNAVLAAPPTSDERIGGAG